jgi:hypothetical protein
MNLAMKSVGNPDAGNPQVRFDERERETGRLQTAQANAPFLDPAFGCIRKDALRIKRTITPSP